MTPDKDVQDSAEKPGRVHPVPDPDQRRFYRPEDTAETRRAIFTDWASI